MLLIFQNITIQKDIINHLNNIIIIKKINIRNNNNNCIFHTKQYSELFYY